MLWLPVFAVALMCLGGLIALLNWWYLFLSWRTGQFHSPLPLIGALLLGGGMLLLPSTRLFAWVGLLADFGTLALLLAMPRIVNEMWSTSGYNLLEEYVGNRGIKTVNLCLFRNGVFTIKQIFRRPPDECGVVQAGTIGTWQRERERLLLRMDGQSAEFEPLPTIEAKGLRQVVGFSSYEKSEDYSLAGIDLRVSYVRGVTNR